eukprot:4296071-Amphidinium_carterae.1
MCFFGSLEKRTVNNLTFNCKCDVRLAKLAETQTQGLLRLAQHVGRLGVVCRKRTSLLPFGVGSLIRCDGGLYSCIFVGFLLNTTVPPPPVKSPKRLGQTLCHVVVLEDRTTSSKFT